MAKRVSSVTKKRLRKDLKKKNKTRTKRATTKNLSRRGRGVSKNSVSRKKRVNRNLAKRSVKNQKRRQRRRNVNRSMKGGATQEELEKAVEEASKEVEVTTKAADKAREDADKEIADGMKRVRQGKINTQELNSIRNKHDKLVSDAAKDKMAAIAKLRQATEAVGAKSDEVRAAEPAVDVDDINIEEGKEGEEDNEDQEVSSGGSVEESKDSEGEEEGESKRAEDSEDEEDEGSDEEPETETGGAAAVASNISSESVGVVDDDNEEENKDLTQVNANVGQAQSIALAAIENEQQAKVKSVLDNMLTTLAQLKENSDDVSEEYNQPSDGNEDKYGKYTKIVDRLIADVDDLYKYVKGDTKIMAEALSGRINGIGMLIEALKDSVEGKSETLIKNNSQIIEKVEEIIKQYLTIISSLSDDEEGSDEEGSDEEAKAVSETDEETDEGEESETDEENESDEEDTDEESETDEGEETETDDENEDDKIVSQAELAEGQPTEVEEGKAGEDIEDGGAAVDAIAEPEDEDDVGAGAEPDIKNVDMDTQTTPEITNNVNVIKVPGNGNERSVTVRITFTDDGVITGLHQAGVDKPEAVIGQVASALKSNLEAEKKPVVPKLKLSKPGMLNRIKRKVKADAVPETDDNEEMSDDLRQTERRELEADKDEIARQLFNKKDATYSNLTQTEKEQVEQEHARRVNERMAEVHKKSQSQKPAPNTIKTKPVTKSEEERASQTARSLERSRKAAASRKKVQTKKST